MHSCKFVLCYKWVGVFFSMLGPYEISIYFPLHDTYVAKFSPSDEIKSGGRDDCSKVELLGSAVLLRCNYHELQ